MDDENEVLLDLLTRAIVYVKLAADDPAHLNNPAEILMRDIDELFQKLDG